MCKHVALPLKCSNTMRRILSMFIWVIGVSTLYSQSNTYWQQHVDYTMDIDMDVETYRFKGRQKLVYTNNSPDTLKEVFYHLQFNAFQPGSDMDIRLQNIADPDRRMSVNKGTKEEPVYEDLATKFYEHFLGIAHAMARSCGEGFGLWNEDDGFFYDVLHMPDGSVLPLKVRSLVGLIPLLAVETIEPQVLAAQHEFARRMRWFTRHRPHLSGNMASTEVHGVGERVITAILTRERLVRVLRAMLDEDEFLSPYGIRSLSKVHRARPFTVSFGAESFSIDYQPAESTSGLFGGNSNWRGPIWFPINYLIIEALYRFHRYYGDDLVIECPTRSGNWMTLAEVAVDLSTRLTRLFLPDAEGRRPADGDRSIYQNPHWRNGVLFYEYFHGDSGAGLGASHQTGWTGLVAELIQRCGGGACDFGDWVHE